ncbi:TetR/AcrR family transcriptional regulator [Sphingomonas oryzagri]
MTLTAQVSRRRSSGGSPRERIIDAARKLFDAKGFHATTTAELAAEADVSVGQIYRLFTSKDDVVLTIVEENVRDRVQQMHLIFDTVERGDRTLFEAIKAIAGTSLQRQDGSLSFEILAEARRNPPVAQRLESLTAFYRDGVRRLAALARPDLPARELDAYADIMTACFIGLGHRPALAPASKVNEASDSTACVLMRSLGLASDHKPNVK